jgi:hypothetical protein
MRGLITWFMGSLAVAGYAFAAILFILLFFGD